MRGTMKARRRKAGRGFVLIAVMWAGLALLIAVGAHLATTRGDAMTARAEQETARAVMLARSGLNLALAALAAGDAALPVPRDGTPWIIGMAEGEVVLRVEDEAGKIDVNHAPVEILRPALARLGAQAGVDAFEASNLAQAIVARREAGGAIGSLEELAAALDLDPAVAQAATGMLTTLNLTPRIDPASAPAAVLASLPGVGEGEAEDIVARRRAGGPVPRLGAAAVWLAPREGPTYRITAEATLSTGIRARLSALVAARGIGFRGGRMEYEVLWVGGAR